MTAETIIEAVAEKHGIKPAAIRRSTKHTRVKVHVLARREAMALVRKELGYSLAQIGRVFGGFHHTSVLHALRQAGDVDWTPAMTLTREQLTAAVARLTERIEQLEAEARQTRNGSGVATRTLRSPSTCRESGGTRSGDAGGVEEGCSVRKRVVIFV